MVKLPLSFFIVYHCIGKKHLDHSKMNTLADSSWSVVVVCVLLTGYMYGLCEKLRHLRDVTGGGGYS